MPVTLKPQWKARFRSTLVDVDSLFVDTKLRDFARQRKTEEATNFISECSKKKQNIFIPDAELLLEAVIMGGGVGFALSRLPWEIINPHFKVPVGTHRYNDGRPKKIGDVIRWADSTLQTGGDHLVITARYRTIIAVAKIAWGSTSNISAIMGCWSPDGNGDIEQFNRMNELRWCILGMPTTAKLAARQAATNISKYPILIGFPDHSGYYCADWVYHPLKDAGLIHDASPSKIIYTVKDGSKRGYSEQVIREAATLIMGDEIPQFSGGKFVIVYVPSSNSDLTDQKQQSSWHVAKLVEERSGGLGTIVNVLIRETSVNTKNGSTEDSVQNHMESMRLVDDCRDILDGQNVLLVDDVITDGTQTEAAECLLRIQAEPLSITRFALMRTAKNTRDAAAKEAIRIANETGKGAKISRERYVVPFEPLPDHFSGMRYCPAKRPSQP